MGYDIKIGKYRHFKGNEYEVIGIVKHSETAEEMVVYKALYGAQELWACPANMRNEIVDCGGIRCKRITYIGDEGNNLQTRIIPCMVRMWLRHTISIIL